MRSFVAHCGSSARKAVAGSENGLGDFVRIVGRGTSTKVPCAGGARMVDHDGVGP
jgi:hypothetical protein